MLPQTLQSWVASLTWVRLPKLRFIFEPWESPKNTETLCDMGGAFSYSLSPHISQASLQYKSAMTGTFHLSAMFSSVIKAKNLKLYKKLQNLLSLFQKLKSRLMSALPTHMSLRVCLSKNQPRCPRAKIFFLEIGSRHYGKVPRDQKTRSRPPQGAAGAVFWF